MSCNCNGILTWFVLFWFLKKNSNLTFLLGHIITENTGLNLNYLLVHKHDTRCVLLHLNFWIYSTGATISFAPWTCTACHPFHHDCEQVQHPIMMSQLSWCGLLEATLREITGTSTHETLYNTVKVGLVEIKQEMCHIFTVLNHKMTTICYQRLRKHAKWKYSLLWQASGLIFKFI